MASLSLEFEGNSSFLKEHYFPPIHLDKNSEYVCGLIDFQAYNSIPNIDDTNNKFYYGTFEKKGKNRKRKAITFSVQSGVFEIDEFCKIIVKLFEKNGLKINIRFDKQTMKFKLNCNKIINFVPNDSIRDVFAFNNRKLTANDTHTSDTTINNTIISNELDIHGNNKIYVSFNNKFYIDEPEEEKDGGKEDEYNFTANVITIPTGCYETDDIEKFLVNTLSEINLQLRINRNTLKCEIFCTQDLDFRPNDTIGSLLGFGKQILIRNQWHTSSGIIDILRVNIMRIECDIVTGSYINNKPAHILYSFFPTVESGFNIVHTPQNVVYLPITVRESIESISIRIIDQNNQLVNFRGEKINVKINIKKL